ncbi:hypothetical protein BDZ89DRAFT_625541 [Hymenopellis radicata]|nr:hypothetical protein BDZ89DRAFT_625541 [Hymenopellis radicata]
MLYTCIMYNWRRSSFNAAVSGFRSHFRATTSPLLRARRIPDVHCASWIRRVGAFHALAGVVPVIHMIRLAASRRPQRLPSTMPGTTSGHHA